MNKKIRSITAVVIVLSFLLTMSTALAVPEDKDEVSVVQVEIANTITALEARRSASAVRSDFELTWDDILDMYPSAVRRTLEVVPNTTWLEWFAMNEDMGYVILGFYADGSIIDSEDIDHTYISAGQHFLVAHDYEFPERVFALYTFVAPSEQPTSVPTSTVRPSGGINITINNTNVNVNGSSVSVSTNIAGLVRLAQALNGVYPLSADEIKAYDFNRNGYIDITDLVIMANMLH